MNELPPKHIPNDFRIYENVEYQRYWEGVARQKLDDLERIIVRKLLPARGSRIIDIGCGYGRLADCYADRFTDIVMFDGSESLLRSAQQSLSGNILYVLGDIASLPFHRSAFDAALMVRVFHHLNQPQEMLKGIQQILCQGGVLVMNYSNKRNALRMARFLFRRSVPNPFSHETLTLEANFFHHHPAFMEELFANTGFGRANCQGAGIFDKLAAVSGPFSGLLPSGAALAQFFGKTTLAPWIFCKVKTQQAEPLYPASSLDDLLACPVCKNALNREISAYACQKCRKTYSIRENMVDMRVR